MCKISPYIIRNLYNEHHNLYKFLENDFNTNKKQNKQKIKLGYIEYIYDIRTIYIKYNNFTYKIKKIADINLSPYIDEKSYLEIINKMKDLFNNKEISILELDSEKVYLYYEGECINTIINNMITLHDINMWHI